MTKELLCAACLSDIMLLHIYTDLEALSHSSERDRYKYRAQSEL